MSPDYSTGCKCGGQDSRCCVPCLTDRAALAVERATEALVRNQVAREALAQTYPMEAN